MKMTKQRWIGLIAGIAILLAAFGAVLAATVVQVSREVPSTLTTAEVLADDNMALYHDPDGTDPVTSLEFPWFQPPLAGSEIVKTLYIRNESPIDLGNL